MDANALFINAIDHWRDVRGKGTAIIPPPLEDKAMILGVLQRVYGKSNSVSTLIITDNFNQRSELIEYLTNQDDEDNNKEFKRLIDEKFIKIFTIKLVENDNFNMTPFLTIVYHIDEVCKNLISLLNRTKFNLIVLNRLSITGEDLNKIYSIAPLLNDFKQNELDAIRVSTPVEEMRIGVNMPTDSDDYKLLEYYNEFISTSINIFGSFDNIEYARVGDKRCNISASQFCYNLAYENGWNEHLDMSNDLNVQFDSMYNPANINERASQTYEIMRKRRTLLANYDAKLDAILNIVKENKDKHILIINKYADFAAKVTTYLNNLSELDICGNYHNRVDSIPASTIDGQPIYIKSGVHKGERRMLGADAQKSLNEQRFIYGYINILSTNNSPDKNLNVPIDVIIITSPECEEIESYIYRLSKVTYPSDVIKLYTLYVKNSTEEKRINNKTLSATHKLINCEPENVKIDENCNFIVAD